MLKPIADAVGDQIEVAPRRRHPPRLRRRQGARPRSPRGDDRPRLPVGARRPTARPASRTSSTSCAAASTPPCSAWACRRSTSCTPELFDIPDGFHRPSACRPTGRRTSALAVTASSAGLPVESAALPGGTWCWCRSARSSSTARTSRSTPTPRSPTPSPSGWPTCSSDRVLVAPAITYGASGEHQMFPAPPRSAPTPCARCWSS